jgi:hypothetical protein
MHRSIRPPILRRREADARGSSDSSSPHFHDSTGDDMRQLLSALTLVALTATMAGAQQTDHQHHASKADSVHRMKATCPLHLESLELTAGQKRAVDSLRADHMTLMKAGVRSILTDAQRVTFDKAAAHAAETAAMQKQNEQDGMTCCKECMQRTAHPADAKHEG